MSRTAGVVSSAVMCALVLNGCGGPADGDEVACESVIGADNAMIEYVEAIEKHTAETRAQAGAFWAAFPGVVQDAQTVAEDAELLLDLAILKRYVDETDIRNEKDLAWRLQLTTVEETCQDLGVDVTLG